MRIGADEAGKGDYFGYLVVAAVAVDERSEKALAKLRVRDSKRMSEAAIRSAAPAIKKLCAYEIVRISPPRYNALYKRFKNLNKLLAWAYARAIENLLERTGAEHVVTDKFGDEKFLAGALFEKSRSVRIEQRVRAESDIAVAAASVLARYEFVRTLRALSRSVGYSLPKGSAHVKEAVRFLREHYGEGVLSEVAKVHFKTTRQK